MEEGYHYELARGHVVVSEVPNYFHGMQLDASNQAFKEYRATNPGINHAISGGSDCQLLAAE